jgi:alpha-L-rhamnosidase
MRLEFCEGEFDTLYGRVGSSWEYLSNGKIKIVATVPCNTTAKIILPNGEIHERASGKYEFVI